ncbi:hypothetical protein ACQJBY_069417 [Aegilops geniculata]
MSSPHRLLPIASSTPGPLSWLRLPATRPAGFPRISDSSVRVALGRLPRRAPGHRVSCLAAPTVPSARLRRPCLAAAPPGRLRLRPPAVRPGSTSPPAAPGRKKRRGGRLPIPSKREVDAGCIFFFKKKEEFFPAASSWQKRRKKKKCAARRLAAWPAMPSRLGRVPLAAWPVKPDRLDPPRGPGGSRATPSGCAGALRERRAAPTVFGKLRLNCAKSNLSSSPHIFASRKHG